MRRFLLAACVAALAYGAEPAPAASQINSRAACEEYCATIAAGCYLFLGLFVREACSKFYEGCTGGCYAALIDANDDEEEKGW